MQYLFYANLFEYLVKKTEYDSFWYLTKCYFHEIEK